MDGFENLLSPREWHEWSGRAVGDVDEKMKVSDGDFSKAEAGVRISRDASELGVERLVASHVGEIDAE